MRNLSLVDVWQRTKNWLRLHRWSIIFLGFWWVYFTRFWNQALYIDERGNIYANLVNIWGDWAAHFTMGSSFAYRSLLPLESPFFAGATFSYPFIVNLISGGLVRLGVPFFTAFILPSWLFSGLTVTALYWWFRTWLGSQWRAITATTLMLCTGGLGVLALLKVVVLDEQPLQTLWELPYQATNNADLGIRWLSMVDSMIIPQRAFVLGFPLALLCLTLVYRWVTHQQRLRAWQAHCLGILLGLLPIIHTHSFLAVGGILSCWMVLDLAPHWRQAISLTEIWQRLQLWLRIGLTAVIIATPLFLVFFAEQVGGFVRWEPGWLTNEFGLSWWELWARNWGPTLVVSIIGISISLRFRRAYWGWPFLVWFILPNLFIFQPWPWDNTKLLIWGAVGITGFATIALSWLWQHRSVLVKAATFLIFLCCIASGAYELYWIQRADLHNFQMYSAEEWQLSQWVITNTPAESRWLTGAEHNHWLYNLTGRQTLMAYRGWLWTQGYNYFEREQDVTQLFLQPTPTKLQELGVDYVVIGPEEVTRWRAREEAFLQYGEVVYRTPTTALIRIK